MSENLKAFVLMPFDSEFKSIYENLVKPTLEDAGYHVTRADSTLDQRNILRDIIKGIATADLIIADLTTLKPNVFYELGIAHGFKIPTILITQSIDTMPFDLRPYRTIQYSTHFDEAPKLKEKIKEIAEKHSRKEISFESPVSDFLSLESDSSKIPNRPVTIIDAKLQGNSDSEKGFLDFIVEGDEAAKGLSIILAEFTTETESIGNKMKNHTESIQKLRKNPQPGLANQLHKIAVIAGSDMTNYSAKIEEKLPTYDKDVDKLIESYTGYIMLIQPISEQDKESLLKYRQSIAVLLEANKKGLDGVRSFRNSVLDLGKLNISREINRASNRMSQTLYNLISLMEKTEAFCITTINLIDEKLKVK